MKKVYIIIIRVFPCSSMQGAEMVLDNVEKWISLEEAVEYLEIKPCIFRKWIKRRKIFLQGR